MIFHKFFEFSLENVKGFMEPSFELPFKTREKVFDN
jgi:hypothetical protein